MQTLLIQLLLFPVLYTAGVPSGLLASSSAGDKTSDPTASKRKFGDMVGLQVKFAQGQPLSDLSMLDELGVRWVRDVVYWPVIEPSPGKYLEFPDAFQQRLDYYREHGIGLVFLLAYANPQAYPATAEDPLRPVNPQVFGRYARQVARMLSGQNVRFVLEIWNEPHNFDLRKLVGGAWNGVPPSPWVEHYVKMVAEAVHQVKNLDPHITLLTDDDMWVLHYRFLDAGLPPNLDGFAFHPYTRGAPEIAAVDAYTKWVRPYTVVDKSRSFVSAAKRLRDYGESRLDAVPQLWITEWGWPVGEDQGKGQASEELLAAYLPRAFIIAAAAGIRGMCWFSARDTVDGPMGLTGNDGRRRKSWYAFKTMSEILGDYHLVRQLQGGDHPTSGVQAFLFRTDQEYRVVAWNVDGQRSVLELPQTLTRLRIQDVFGQPLATRVGSSGAVRAGFAAAPIYVSGLVSENLKQLRLYTTD